MRQAGSPSAKPLVHAVEHKEAGKHRENYDAVDCEMEGVKGVSPVAAGFSTGHDNPCFNRAAGL
jgi:hypothetical protein